MSWEQVLAVGGGVGTQLDRNQAHPPCLAPQAPTPSPGPAPGGGKGAGGSGVPGRHPPQPLTLDKHCDLKHSREHQPFHQERFNLLGVRSHKSQAGRFIASRSGIDHGEKATSPSHTRSFNKVENVKYTRPTPGAGCCGQRPMSLWREVTYASCHPVLPGRLREAKGTSQATAGVHDLGDSCPELERARKVQAWVGGWGRGSPTPPAQFRLLPPIPGNTSPALSGKPLTSRAPVWEDDSLRRKANPCPSGLNPPSGNARFPGQASQRSEIPVLPGRSQVLSDCPTPTSPVTAGKLRPRAGGVPSAMSSPPQTYRPL